MLKDNHATEIAQILEKYPQANKRSAVMPLLFLAQREEGYISKDAIKEIAGLLDLDPTDVGSLIGYYTLFHDKPGGKYRIQICTDLPCALRGAEKFSHEVCEMLNIQVGETTEDGFITVEEVMCLAACDRAPLFQVQDKDGIQYHENMSLESTTAFVKSIREQDANE